jgi:hypothetical protein
MGKLKPTQTKVLVLFNDGYYGLELLKVTNPYEVFIACMPWGFPIGIYATEDGAKAACELVDNGKDMEEWRKRNEKLGIFMPRETCFYKPYGLPTLAQLFAVHGELVKESQIHILSLVEDASWIGDGLLDWCKENRPEWFEAIDKEK